MKPIGIFFTFCSSQKTLKLTWKKKKKMKKKKKKKKRKERNGKNERN